MQIFLFIISLILTYVIAYRGESKYDLTKEEFQNHIAIVISTLLVFSFVYCMFNLYIYLTNILLS